VTDLATSSRATTGADAPRHGFRPSARRRTRMAAGVALGAVAIALNLVVYTGLDRRAPVVQVVRDVPAGELISAADLRTVDVDVDDSVPVVRTTSDVVGHYAAVRLVAGSLVTAASLRPAPLVTPGAAVVGIRVPEGALPAGLRERVPVQLVVPPDPSTADGLPRTVTGRVVGLPTTSESALGTVSLSVEVPADRAAVVAAADDVRVVLVEPTPDPAVREPSG
jgi:SAF domain